MEGLQRTRARRLSWWLGGVAAIAAGALVVGLPAAEAQETPVTMSVGIIPHDQVITGTDVTFLVAVSPTADPVPTGNVLVRTAEGDIPLGNANLATNGLATVTVPDFDRPDLGIVPLVVEYAGDEEYAEAQIGTHVTELEAAQPEQYVRRLYDDVLLRDPDEAGFDYWVAQMDGGTPRNVVAHSFVRSTDNYGVEVDDAYERLLEREADAGGRTHYVAAFGTGMTDAQLDFYLTSSSEFFTDADLGNGSNAGFVDALYANLLGRSGDTAGRNYWIGQLTGGASRTDVAFSFVMSDENLGNEVSSLYLRFLNRQASPENRTAGAALLRLTTVQMLFVLEQQMATSTEYLNKVPPLLVVD